MSFGLVPQKRLLDRPLARFPSLLRDLFEEDFLPGLSNELGFGGIKMYEENNQLHVEVPMPGINSNDIDINLGRGVLYVTGESKEEEKDKKRKFYHSAIRSYSYNIPLPTQVEDKQEPQASYSDGILKVIFPISKQEISKKIQVRGSKSSKAG